MKTASGPILISVAAPDSHRISGRLYVVLITSVAALGGLLFGYDTAVISGAIGLLRDHFTLSAAATGWAASSALAGCVLGAAGAGKGSDRYGRHRMLLLSGICFLVSAVGTALASTFTVFILFRIVAGLGIGAASVASPLYIGESAPAKWRGRLVALNQLAIGQLASIQNKRVRIALERLRLSIKEFLDELPPSMDAAYVAAISPVDANPPRVFLPTRPSLLNAGDSARIFIVFSGQTAVAEIKLYSRGLGDRQWKSVTAAHSGRSVYSAQLGPFQASDATIEYYVAASGNSPAMSAPPQAPANLYTLNILSS
jgi:hypothetical protein